MLDRRINPDWPPEVVDALDDLRQGDVIPWPADTAYVSSDRHVLYGEPPEGDATGEQVLVALDPPPAFGVIVSQTCDIDEQGGVRRKPWIQYAPVYNADDAPRSGNHTWELDGPGLPDGSWYADLRFEGAAEKNTLVGVTAIRGFSTEADADTFSRHLGHLRSRPALANHLVETVTEHLRQYRKGKSAGQRKRFREQVAEVRLDITDGSRMKPHAVRLVVLHNGPPTDEMREWFEVWYDDARPEALKQGIELHAVYHLDATSLNYLEIRDLIEVDTSG